MAAQLIEPSQNIIASSFIGLQSYSEEQANIFFGRDEEIDSLTKLVKSNILTIVFGKSGTGKTSLLNAGVFPKLREDYCLPFRIRLEFRDDSPDLITQIKNVLRKEIDKYGFKAESYPSAETLWEYFHKEPLWKSITPILIFDQFEEIFTLAKKNPRFANKELAIFWEELSDLIENSIPGRLKDQFLNHKEEINYRYKQPQIKVLFSFREEFLPEFESIPSNIPSLKYSRFRLLPMNENQAYEVITKTWKNKIDPAQAKEIVTFFTNETGRNNYKIAEIEPSLLSQVCFYLDKERIRAGKDKITAEFLNKYPKETILRSIYGQVLTESNEALGPAQHNVAINSENPVKVFVEDKLITNEGYRTKYALTDQDEKIRPGIEVLKSKYFVRDDGKSIELTHDVLAPIIKVDREKRRAKIALAEANKRARRKAILIIILALLTGIAFWGYATYKRNIAKHEETAATMHTEELNKQIQKDSTRLEEIKKDISLLGSNNKHGKNTGPRFPNGYSDSSLSRILEEYQMDSAQIATLKKEYEKLKNQKADLESTISLQNGQITGFRTNQNKLDSINTAARRLINILTRQIFDDSLKIVLLQNNYDALRKAFNEYKLKNPEPYTLSVEPEEPESDSNSLKLNLYYGSTKKDRVEVPGNLKIYIIPYSNANKTIIRDAKVYEINCDQNNLNKAVGYRIAKYKNGHYIFPDLPAGKYLIKICTYYGGYYNYTKKSTGNPTLNWNASPPIR